MPSSSALDELYASDEFRLQRDNNLRFQIGEHCMQLRRFRTKSQSELAKAMKTSQSAIARIEAGEENVTVDTLRRLIIALKGRFQVSIQPEEMPVPQRQTWWEILASSDNTYSSDWNLIWRITRQAGNLEQKVEGSERIVDTTWPERYLPPAPEATIGPTEKEQWGHEQKATA